MLPINMKAPLIVVKREFYDQFLAGTKTVEYRRHRRPFLATTYYPGRYVRLAYSYDVNKYPTRLARVVSFEVLRVEQLRASEHMLLQTVYRDLVGSDEIALITIALHEAG